MAEPSTERPEGGAPPGRLVAFLRAHFGGLPHVYWVVWSGILVSRAGTMVVPFLTLYLTDQRGMSVGWAGSVVTMLGLGSTCSQLVGGFLSDLWGRRATFATGPVAAGAALLALGYVRGLPATLAAAFVAGLCLQLYQPASGAIVADTVPKEHRARAYGLLYWAVNVGFSIASVLGGVLAQRGFLWLFWIDAVTCVVFGLLIWWRLPPDDVDGAKGDARPAGGYREVLRDRVMVSYVVLLLLHASVQFQVGSTLPLAMVDSGLTPADYGLAVAVNGILVVVVQPLVVRRLSEQDRSNVIACGVLLMGTGFGLGAFMSSLPGYAFTVVIWTAGEITIAAVVQTVVADLAPEHLRGRYNGLFGAAYALAAVVAPAGGTQLYAHAGPTALWATCFGLCSLVAAGQWALGRAVRARGTTQQLAETAKE
ncbi:MDR family MFS transporter [Streptomyces spongiae]|uniref:MFS transporter n=1 Tax=Streptomyces spongiae TaxID=565072 RepID=A0A5N8XCM2_9ACTN|nr:MFS transporter [Streptomyces spongiae]MPY57147.1 MFS transporter [Streptomyces spongiae]